MTRAGPISLRERFAALRFLADRTPETDAETGEGAFAELSPCNGGGVYIAHFAGNSEWERHRSGDEPVLVVEGAATLVLLVDGAEVHNRLREGELLVVPKGTWHRFIVPEGVKLLTVTPQPTDHSAGSPDDSA
ncbi:MAG: cupin domain-containing protein [Planctomycetota bacterium]